MSEQKQPTQSRLNTALTVILAFSAIGFVYYTFNNYENVQQYLLFKNAKFNNTKQKNKTITEVAFYSSLLTLFILTIKFVISTFLKNRNIDPYVNALKNLTLSQFQQLAIFLGLYAYVLYKIDLDDQILRLIPTWFIISRLADIVGSILQTTIIYNLKQFGIVLSVVVNILMIGEIFEMDAFSCLKW